VVHSSSGGTQGTQQAVGQHLVVFGNQYPHAVSFFGAVRPTAPKF
jgi:hypothetical protein